MSLDNTYASELTSNSYRSASDRFCPWDIYTARDHRAAVAGSNEFAVVPQLRVLIETT